MIGLNDALSELKIPCASIQLDYEGCTYAGPGIVIWTPTSGLLIDGVLKVASGQHPKRFGVGQVRFHERSFRRTIRLRTPFGMNGLIFHRGLEFPFGLINEGHFESRFAACTLYCRDNHPPKHAFGEMLYQGEIPRLPQPVRTVVDIAGRKVAEQLSLGLDYNENGVQFSCRADSAKHFALCWGMKNRLENGIRNWPRAVSLAWRLLCGFDVLPIASEIRDTRMRILSLQRQQAERSMEWFTPLERDAVITGERLAVLSSFFESKSKEAIVAERLLFQLMDAADARTWNARQFLLGTALEGVLRSLYSIPFRPGARTMGFDISKLVDRLINKHFDANWAIVSKRVTETFKRMRHSAAHPDWIADTTSGHTSPEMHLMFDDCVFMSRFYGFLILAMAQVPGLLPMFPIPAANWEPLVTYGSDL